MSNKPLVSVAVTTYQHKDFIGPCLDSILLQDYRPIEIVVADDGSIDGSQEIIKEYALRHPDLFVLKLSEVNRGITANSNEALFACSGKYISWMSGDDLMLSGKIRRQVEHLEQNPQCSIVYHNVEVFDSLSMKVISKFNNRLNAYQGDATVVIKFGTFNCACSNMVRRERSPLNGFDVELTVASDWYYWVEILLNGGTIEYLPDILGRYRRHSSNVTDKSAASYLVGLEDHLRTCRKILARAPQYSRIVSYRMSVIYRMKRHSGYIPNLIMSLKCNPLNWRSLALLLIFCVSLGRLKY